MRALTASSIFALLLTACGPELTRKVVAVTANGVQISTTDPLDLSVTTPNPSTAVGCALARGLRDGKSVVEMTVGPEVTAATFSVGSNGHTSVSLGYSYGPNDTRTEFIELKVTRDSLTIMGSITLTGGAPGESFQVDLTVTLANGTTPSPSCRLIITPAQ